MLIMVNLKIYAVSVLRQLFLRSCGVLINFFAVLRYSEPPNACLYTQAGEEIMEDVALRHPIIFDIYNIREYFHGHKLLS